MRATGTAAIDAQQQAEQMTRNVLIAVNDAPWDELEQVLRNHNAVLQLNWGGDYSLLDVDGKILFYKHMAEYSFTAIAEIQTAFLYEAALLKPSVNGRDRGKGGGGSGNRPIASVTYEPSPTEPPPEPTEPPQPRFDDLDGVPWAREGILFLAERGVIRGVGNNKFASEDYVTREQFVKMLVIALGIDYADGTTNFADVDAREWYAPYIAGAYAHNITIGVSDHLFGVGMEITRADLAVLTYRAATAAGIPLPLRTEKTDFADSGDIPNYAAAGVEAMQRANIINGVGGGLFAPNESATRAMAAKVIYELVRSK
jgi:hypothetical protein